MSNLINGNCINLFIKEDNQFTRVAESTVFSLQTETNIKQIVSKDDSDSFMKLKVLNIYWRIEGESLVPVGDDKLFEYIVKNKKLRICYGTIQEGQSTPPDYGYIGSCYLTDLELQANTGEAAMYNYTLVGVSPLEYGAIDKPDDDTPVDFNTKTTPVLEFTSAGGMCYEGDDPDIGTLSNPDNLPVKFNIIKID